MKIGIGIPEQIIGFGTTHNRREPPFPPGGISTQARLDTPRVARAVDGASINRDSTGPCRPGAAVAA
jgi:hypothetical protein